MEPYLYCGICFKDGKERALFLTSCAHVLCQEHVNLSKYDGNFKKKERKDK